MSILEIVFALIGVLGTGTAIYQTAVLHETKKHRSELQFLLAGIHQLALSKQLALNNKLGLLPPIRDEKDLAIFRAHSQARDNLMEVASAISALEGAISTETSAIKSMLEKTLEQVKLNNQLQAEGLKNPTLPKQPEAGTAAEPRGRRDAEHGGDA